MGLASQLTDRPSSGEGRGGEAHRHEDGERKGKEEKRVGLGSKYLSMFWSVLLSLQI